MSNAQKAAEKAGNALRQEGLIFQAPHQESDKVEEILEPIIESAIEVDRKKMVKLIEKEFEMPERPTALAEDRGLMNAISILEADHE